MGAIQSAPPSDKLPSLQIRLDAGACIPERKTEGAAGYTVCAREAGAVEAGAVAKVRTGVYAAIPPGLFGAIKGRTGLALRGILAFEATIASDYREEICVLLHNTRTDGTFFYDAGERIAQMVLLPCIVLNVEEVPELDLTHRGDSGLVTTDGIQMHPIVVSGSGDSEYWAEDVEAAEAVYTVPHP